jgi:hypothetical protein
MIIEGFKMLDNSAQTWNSADHHIKFSWLAKYGKTFSSCTYADNDFNNLSSVLQQLFINWYRAKHNV